MRIQIDPDKCTGCKTCEVICSFSENHAINPRKARVEVIRVDKTGLDIPVMCVQCIKPKCVEACPERAIWKKDDGIVRVNEGECVGCGICSEACIIGAIKVDPDSGIPLICNLCDGKPKCVEWCATKALRFSSTTEGTNQKWPYVFAHSKKNVEKWKLPKETLEHVKKMMHRS